MRDAKEENLSTVGVDIGELIMKRDNEEVVFSTWDFGGQVSEISFQLFFY